MELTIFFITRLIMLFAVMQLINAVIAEETEINEVSGWY